MMGDPNTRLGSRTLEPSRTDTQMFVGVLQSYDAIWNIWYTQGTTEKE
ncbi:MAG: hypothetical protein IID03_07385 [Candidatus Dadabacteria bacterium]|nr:hypothetical protein [Candidatus Dadabacteria bacterium]